MFAEVDEKYGILLWRGYNNFFASIYQGSFIIFSLFL